MDLTALVKERCLSLFMDVSFSPLYDSQDQSYIYCVSDCLVGELGVMCPTGSGGG